ncbi:putative quinol monooxygenase [Saccharothrix sp. HUAS TT1]|uniref:putative quinol monooxygenase n=1 Tax=unclassified Saccharothrix TaxID=2593673 RepID=UPI00345B567C
MTTSVKGITVPTFLLHITVKPEHQAEAVEVLAEIQRLSLVDEGCVDFVWLRHEEDGNKFTLFERWESQENLDDHLAKIIPVWEEFAHCLEGDPVSQSVRAVTELA